MSHVVYTQEVIYCILIILFQDNGTIQNLLLNKQTFKKNSKLNWKAKESSENNANYVTLTGQVDIIHGMMPEIISAVIN